MSSFRDKEYKILIADDHRLFRQQVAKILRNMSDISLVEEVSNGLEVIEKIKTERWDLLLLDIEMPRMGGLATLVELKSHTLPPVIIVSMHAEESVVNRAYNLGIKGYLHKDSETEEFKKAIVAVLNGKHYFSNKFQDMVFDHVVRRDYLKEKGPKLTRKEIEILKLICQQKTGKEISSQLCISFQTVNSYRTSLLRKTNSQNMAGLAIYAIEHGLYRS